MVLAAPVDAWPGERKFLEMFFPSRFLFPLQPLSMDAGSLFLFHVALQREQNECLGPKKSGRWRKAEERRAWGGRGAPLTHYWHSSPAFQQP